MKNRVGLITMHNVYNMGAMLQAYALQTILLSEGNECEIIDFIPNLRKGLRNYFPKNQGIGKFRRTLSWIKWLPQRILWRKPYDKFKKEHLNISRESFYENKKIYEYDFNYDVFVTGSDQVWNAASTDGLSPFYFLDFVKNSKKVSYAASMSNKQFTSCESEKIKEYLSTFDAISVREHQTVPLLESICNRDISFVLDPTLLLNSNDWKCLANESSINIKEDYLLVYMLGDVPEMLELAKRIANEKNLKVVKFGWDIRKKRNVDYNISFKEPQDFVKLFLDCKYVITNSFHGTVFSINFNKDFVSIPSSNKNPRFVSILQTLFIENRLYDKDISIKTYLDSIDYKKVNNLLNDLRFDSLKYIHQNITNSTHGELNE